MGKKKDFWELADSTILGRTKKAQLLQIARAEHEQVESYRTQFNLQAEQLRDREVLVAQLNAQIKKLGTVDPEVLRGLVGKFDEQQRNHEQELSKLQSAAKNWEKLSQNYKDVIATQQTEINHLTAVMQNLKRFAKMSPQKAGQAFVDWLFGQQDKAG